jgi:hypothetical protein
MDLRDGQRDDAAGGWQCLVGQVGVGPERDDKERECASYHNRFAYNHDLSSYGGGTIPTWSLSPNSNTAAGDPPCCIPSGETRLHTAGNTTT